MKLILKIIAWIQTIFGALFILAPIVILIWMFTPVVRIIWQPITNTEAGELGMWPIVVLPMAFLIALAIPQFIVGFSYLRNRAYSKMVFIPLAIFFAQFYFLMEIFAPTKPIPVFSGENTATGNEVGFIAFVVVSLINALVAILLAFYFRRTSKKLG